MPSSLIGSVGAVVPNYNYAHYLSRRFSSILDQGSAIGGLIFLDDASRDTSVEVAKALIASFSCPVSTITNPVNGGSVLRQWARGAALSGQPFVWIAEADDAARPGMIEALAARLVADPSAIFAFCDSASIDERGALIEDSTKPYASALGDHVLDHDASFSGTEFIQRCLCPRNLVVNASAVLWRTEALRNALARCGDEVDEWKCAGDWRVYAEAADFGGRIHYDAQAFNLHRRHTSSLTNSTSRAKHFAEVVAMEALMRRRFARRENQDARVQQHLSDLRRVWRLG